tara:strand:+ start:1215 stop:1346 length:132 start_codon:yes stop_codon:yes gene_type:complete
LFNNKKAKFFNLSTTKNIDDVANGGIINGIEMMQTTTNKRRPL